MPEYGFCRIRNAERKPCAVTGWSTPFTAKPQDELSNEFPPPVSPPKELALRLIRETCAGERPDPDSRPE